MKNRKLPFGYELRMGKVCIKEPEAEVVRQIFRSYQEGASYNRIAGFLGNQPVPYREDGQSWNKNMVARILEDKPNNSAETPENMRIARERQGTASAAGPGSMRPLRHPDGQKSA